MIFYFREAASDVFGCKQLSDCAAQLPISLTYDSQTSPSLADTFLTVPADPGVSPWAAGQWKINLQIMESDGAILSVEVWRADSGGNDIQLVGGGSASAAIGLVQITFSGVEIPAEKTDRVKVKIFDQVQARFALAASASSVVAPIEQQRLHGRNNTYRRGRFLGWLRRPCEPSLDLDCFPKI